jgi:predicted  nucleic acid-binding Zn ribbon protein
MNMQLDKVLAELKSHADNCANTRNGKARKGAYLYCIALLNQTINKPKQKVCPQCKRKFLFTEVKSGLFCCIACEHGY